VQHRTARAVAALVAVLAVIAFGTAFAVDRLADDGDPSGPEVSGTLKPDAPASATTATTRSTDTSTNGPGRTAPSTGTATTSTGRPTTTDGPSGSAVGAADIGDPYFPGLGNGGYDVDDYHLALAYEPDTDRLEGTATITARATQPLERFDLDLSGLTVETVTVDGQRADHQHHAAELVVEAPRRIDAGDRFTTVVTYAGVPEPDGIAVLGEQGGWIATDEGAYTICQPDGAHTWFPGNDHPSDRATFTVAVTVPDPLVVVASGRLVDERTERGRTTWTWAATDPMAPYLLQVAVGDFTIEERTTPDGLPLRTATSPGYGDQGAQATAATVDMIAFLETVFGPYPFETYGLLVPAEASPNVAFESQTLSLIPPSLIEADSVLLHELAHQWVGDSVTLARWSDIWLNEGFATYAEWLWAEHEGTPLADSVDRSYDGVKEVGSGAPLLGDPGPDRLFDPVVYQRGALTLQALRVEVGDDTFFEIVREWTRRHAGDAVTTADFVALAEELSGRQLDDLFDAWLRHDALPPLPR
jgi:aminopeptidase N